MVFQDKIYLNIFINSCGELSFILNITFFTSLITKLLNFNKVHILYHTHTHKDYISLQVIKFILEKMIKINFIYSLDVFYIKDKSGMKNMTYLLNCTI